MKFLLTALLLPALTCQAQTATQVRPVPHFTAINVGTGIELTITAGHDQRVEVSADTPELRDRIETTVKDGVLTLRYNNEGDLQGRLRRNKHLQASITADQLTALSAHSGAEVHTSGDFDADKFALELSSGAEVHATFATASLSVRQSSGSESSLAGQATIVEVRTSSGAECNGRDLRVDRARAEASSGSSIKLTVKDDLVAEASSGADISYSGSPQLTKRTSSGGGVSRN